MGDKSRIGSLNPIWKTKFQDSRTHYDRMKLGVLSKFVDASYNKEEDRSAIGQMRGVVVFVNDPIVPWPFDSGIMGTDIKTAVNIHVRIPEIHGYIPDPLQFLEDDPKRYNIAKTYPVFTGFERNTRTPGVGDVVLVDFFNPYEKSAGGTYRELITKAEDAPFQLSGSNAKSSFMNGGKVMGLSRMNSKERIGDGIYVPGNNDVYEIIKGYYVNGKRSFLDELRPYYSGGEGLKPEHIDTLIYIISSRCSTSPQYVSTQDVILMGFRRWARSGGLLEMVQPFGLTEQDLIANNYEKAIKLSDDPRWVEVQYKDFAGDLRQILKNIPKTFIYGREIALWYRMVNSGHLPAALSKKDGLKYEDLREHYIRAMAKNDRGIQRINTIEQTIPENEIWR